MKYREAKFLVSIIKETIQFIDKLLEKETTKNDRRIVEPHLGRFRQIRKTSSRHDRKEDLV